MKDYFLQETLSKEWCGGVVPTPVQVGRWEWMKSEILNPIREHLKQPVFISDCLRNMESAKRLLANGYHPSMKSDHFGGEAVDLTSEKHIVQFGPHYSYSTFACDIDGEFDHKQLCRDIYLTVKDLRKHWDDRFVNGFSRHGVEQLILESQKRNGELMTWIHISAPLEAFYKENEAKLIRKMRNNIRFLEFKNGQYQITKFL